MNILVFAPHADDEIIGIGGTLLRHIAEGNKVFVCVVTHGKPLFSDEVVAKIHQEALACHKLMGVEKTFFLDHPAAMLEDVPRHILNRDLQNVIASVAPEEVYLPHWGDMQKDHVIVTEACMVAVRPRSGQTVKRIYAYETISETGWNIPNPQNIFNPNVFIDISSYLPQKIAAMNCYQSQLACFPAARSLEALEAIAKFRGATISVNAAEAFELIREIK